MSMQQRLGDDLKDSMRSRNSVRSDTIRQVKSAITYGELQSNNALDDVQVQEIIGRLVRQHRESIEMFKKGNRQDLMDKEQEEFGILLAYLPEQISSEEVMALARQVAQEVGAQGPADKGKVMGRLMPQVKGKAEGKLVNDAVTEILESLG